MTVILNNLFAKAMSSKAVSSAVNNLGDIHLNLGDHCSKRKVQSPPLAKADPPIASARCIGRGGSTVNVSVKVWKKGKNTVYQTTVETDCPDISMFLETKDGKLSPYVIPFFNKLEKNAQCRHSATTTRSRSCQTACSKPPAGTSALREHTGKHVARKGSNAFQWSISNMLSIVPPSYFNLFNDGEQKQSTPQETPSSCVYAVPSMLSPVISQMNTTLDGGYMEVTRYSSDPAKSVAFDQKVVSGDRVVALASCRPSNQSFLVFDKDDLIDVLQVNSDSVFVGQVAGRPDSGLVRSDAVRRCRAQSTVLDSPLGRLDVGGPGRIDRVRSTVLPRPLSRVNTPAGQPIVQDYVNTEIAHQPWYFGDVERQDAEKKLRFTSNGTFLVRFSPNRKTYAISVSYENDVKHMVINQSGNQYYLDEGYVFNSIVELVGYYKDNSLIESFNTLNTTLQHCYTKCKVFRVIHKYTAPENKYLDLEIGQIVTLVDTIGEDRGWWKGKLNNKVGFFPMSYVEPLTDSEDDN